jgi:RimJ/RimL family protein N-acetyltransferase
VAGIGRLDRIATARLLLRCWDPADAPLLKDAIDESLSELREWLPWATEPSTVDVVAQRLAQFRDDFRAGRDWLYGLFPPDEKRVIGGLGLHPRQGPGVLEIGYWLRTDVTDQGFATEAAAALVRLAFQEHDIERVEIRCDPRNVRSAAIPRRLGFEHRTTLHADTVTPTGAPRDTMVWTLSRRAGVD